MGVQSELELEKIFIEQLVSKGYERVVIKDSDEFRENFKVQLEKHNNIEFSESEFTRIMTHLEGGTIFEKSEKLRGGYLLTRESGEVKHISFIDGKDRGRNIFQVSNQITMKNRYETRYDVTILINGLPLTQVELKKRGVELEQAFNQICRYQSHSYTGLFNFIQLFVISNGVNTKYFSNNRELNFCQSFFWTDRENNRYSQLEKFTEQFLEKNHIVKMITDYIVHNVSQKSLMVLRPYQVYAVEGIISQVENFPNYILSFIFYKFLSQQMEDFANELLQPDELTFFEISDREEYIQAVRKNSIKQLGYFIEPDYLFHKLAFRARTKEMVIEDLVKAMKGIEESTLGQESEHAFVGLFEDVDLTSNKLGKTITEKNSLICDVLRHIDDISFKFEDTEMDILGDAYEYLISQFASGAGKKAGEFYTPQQVSKILAKIVTHGKERIKSVYDPTCGSGSLLLRVSKEKKVSHFYGQEKNPTTYNLARMNMILHGVRFSDFNIEQGDTLEDPQHMEMKFDAVVANPPFALNWSANQTFLSDDRFASVGKLAPKTKAEYAFVQHMIHQLDDEGTMATVLPHGVLFRGSAEGTIREFLIREKNCLDAVIGLPGGIFYGTPIATVILVFKKKRENRDNILFIDASNYFEKIKSQNYLRDEDVERIIEVYGKRESIEKFSHLATLKEIEENDYNLNIPRYVDTFEEEEKIDLDMVAEKLEAIQIKKALVAEGIKKYCGELKIKAPIF